METVQLNNGIKMPMEGFGTFQLKNNQECYKSVLNALHNGYRSIDTASSYFNEKEIGMAIKDSHIPREELFITSKLWIQDTGYENTIQAFNKTLNELDLDYLDLYLIHQPFGDYYGSWHAFEDLYQQGKIRAIGVANFSTDRLVDLYYNSIIHPMVDQIELHPFLHREQDLEVMRQYDVRPEAWGPLCEGLKNIFEYPTLTEIGKKYGKTAAQVALRWNIQRGVVVIPRTSKEEHVKENMDIWDFQLDDNDMELIKSLDLGHSEIIDHRSPQTAKWLNTWHIHD